MDMKGAKVSVAVVGGGAIGGVMAAAAEAAGHDVTLCVRTPIERLELEEDGALRPVPVRIAAEPATAAAADWVLLATKAQDTGSAAAWLERLAGPRTTVVILQNGIGHEERVRPFASTAALVPALVYIAAERVGPGRIRRHNGNRVVVPAGAPGAAFARLVAAGGIEVVEEPDFTTAAWRKLLSNVAANPITALTLQRMGVMHEPAIRDLARGLLQEAVAAGQAAGARLTDEDVDGVLALYASYSGAGGTSMLYDRLAGKPLEHEHLTGAVVRMAERHGVAAPLNRAMLALVDALDRGMRSAPAAEGRVERG
jgi:2-dehydropantoate 2-reductase